MIAEYLREAVSVWQLDFDRAVEPSSPSYRRINVIDMVCGADDDDARSILHAGELFQQQIYNLRPVFPIF